KDEITELLTNYGEIETIWIDSWEWIGYEHEAGLAQQTPGYGAVPMQEIYDHIKAVSPTTLLANNAHQTKPDENAGLDYTDAFGTQVIAGRLTDPRDGKYVSDLDVREATPRLDPFLTPGNTVPSEVANQMAPGWFWVNASNNSLEMSLANRLDEIDLTNQRSGSYLLNASPDNTGQLPAIYVQRLEEIGMARGEGNVALGKPTSQNATYEGFGQVHSAGYAVDGIFSSESGVRIAPDEVRLASSTPQDGSTPWWEVDLESEHSLGEVVLYNRDLLTKRFEDIIVKVLDEERNVVYTSDLLNPDNNLNGPAYLRLLLNEPAVGQYVRVERVTSDGNGGHVLSLAEVQVFLAPAAMGDYNDDGLIDAADYAAWRSHFGTTVTPGSGADGNGDGIVDAADYTVWRDNVGMSAAELAEAGLTVPEPGSVAVLLLGGLRLLTLRQRVG
ncbi:MAG: dockerin type I domain-containing protein, partial [Rhodospirillales bacterium]|nr:dockerin type I domain-containing protein [Rhodospirillales bacterium]